MLPGHTRDRGRTTGRFTRSREVPNASDVGNRGSPAGQSASFFSYIDPDPGPTERPRLRRKPFSM